MMLYMRKAMSLILIFIMLFSFLAVFVGDTYHDGYNKHDLNEPEPQTKTNDNLNDLRGTRADSSNINLLSRPLYGLATDVFTVGDYAYVYVSANFMIFDVTDKSDPQLVGIAKTYNYGFTLEVVGSYAYLADRYYGLLIFDISDPSAPVIIGEYTIGAGTEIADVSISGSIAYLALVDDGLTAVDISVPSNPQFEGSYTGFYVLGVLAEGSTVYAACGLDGLRIIDMSTPSSPVEIGYNDTHYSERVEVSGDTAYVSYFSNIWMVDITDPSSPSDLGLYGMSDVWEIIIENNIAYVANGWEGFYLLDVSDSPNLSEIGSYDTDGDTMGVHLLGNYIYIADSDGGLLIIDISNPSQPNEVGSFYTGEDPDGAVARGGFAYVADGREGLWIFDVSDPTNPIGVSKVSRIQGSDLTVYAVTLREDIIYVADLNRFYTINVADPYNPVPLGNDFLDGTTMDIHLDWPYAYLPDTFGEGVFIYNVIDPYNLQEIALYDEVNEVYGVHVSGDYLYIANLWDGLNIADVTDPANPINTSTFDTPGWAIDVFIQGDYAYIADYDRGLRIADISDPSSPSYVSDFDTNGLAWGVFVTGGFAFIADDSEGLRVIDVNNPYSLSEVGYYNTSGYARDVFVHGPVAYVSSRHGGLYLLDVSQFTAPQISSTFPEPNATQVSVNTNIIINFTESMNRNSVESAFSYSDGSETWDINDGNSIWSHGDKTLTFTPFNALEYGIEYEITIENTAQDIDGAYFDGDGDGIPGETLEDDYKWSFTTIQPPPRVISTYPFDGENDVNINSNITINFSKRMDISSVESAFSYTDGTNTWGVETGFVTWANGYTKFEFDPDSNLQYDVWYWVTVASSAMDSDGYFLDGDGDGNPGEIEEDDYTWEFNSRSEPPVVANTVPSNGATFIPTETSVVVNFSNSMDEISTENAFNYTDGVTVWTANNGQVTWSNQNRNMTFTPFVNLENDKTYTFSIAHTAQDTEGESLDGDNDGTGGEGPEDDYSWSFTTIPPPPKVISTYPINDAQDILLDTEIRINFSKPMDTNSVESAFSYTNGTVVWDISDGTVTWANNSKTFTFNPDSDLQYMVQYSVNISYEAMDADGLFLDGDGDGQPGEIEDDNYTWSFTTVTLKPRIVSTSPPNGATFVLLNSNITINFSKSMDKTSTRNALSYTDGETVWTASNGQVTWSNQDKNMTFTPYNEFENDRLYTFTIAHTATDTDGVGLDVDGDGVGGEEGEDDYSWSFTTIPPPPHITSTCPEDGADDVPITTSIIINFTKEMNKASVQDAFSFTNGSSTWDISDGMASWIDGDKTFTFIPNLDLQNNAHYIFTLSYSAVDKDNIMLDADEDGIPGEIEDDNYTWEFTTIPSPPVIESVSPLKGSTLVLINTSITIDFSKSMNRLSTEGAFKYTDGISEFSTFNGKVTWSNNDRTMTFTPTVKFANDKTYTVTIRSTAVDTQGGLFDGDKDGIGGEEEDDDYSWSFTTMPTPPVVSSVSPRNLETRVAVDTQIEIRFSKPMDEFSVEAAFSYTYEGSNITWGVSSGNLSWSADSKTMTLGLTLEHDKIYIFKIDFTAMDINGIGLDVDRDKIPGGVDSDEYSWSFTTIKEPPQIVSLQPDEDETNVKLDSNIVITFDRSMNTAYTEKAFSYSYEGSTETFDTSSGSAVWTNSDKILTFNPDADFEEGVRYTVIIEDTARDKDTISFEGYEWSFTTKANSEPLLESGGAREVEDSPNFYKFTIIYTDDDNDEPTEINVIIDGIDWRMYASEPNDEDFRDGKAYEYELELDAGEHTYYFEAENEKHKVRFPSGSNTETLTVEEKDDEQTFGFLEAEYMGVATPICATIGIIILVVIIISVVMLVRRRRAGEEMTFQAFDEGEAPMTFMAEGEEEIMTFQSFDEPSYAGAEPVVIKCPECDSFLKVKSATRPFKFPCKCGADLILR